MLHLTTKLNEESGETQTLPSLPLTGLWLTQNPKQEGVHCDRNVVGAAFLLTTSDVKGAVLVLSSPSNKMVRHQLCPGEVLGGSWANHAQAACHHAIQSYERMSGNDG